MKFILIMLGVLVLAATPVWSNALKPTGLSSPGVTLAANGMARYSILVPALPDAKEERAATELARWLHEMTSADFRIVKEGPTVVRPYISVGATRVLQEAKLPQSQVKLNAEGIAIGQKDGNIYLFGGGQRGPLYAVMAFLEEDLGCRWYSPDTTVIPRSPNLTLAVVPRVENPKLIDERDPYYYDAFGNPDWQIRNRLNSPRSDIPAELGGNMTYASGPRGVLMVHTFNQLVPKEQYFETHPDYYALRDGERHSDGLCETNPEVRKIVIASALEALRATPAATEINISRLDGVSVCKCPVCKAVNEENRSDAGSLIEMVNDVADAIVKDFPKAKASTIAYGDSIDAPTKVKPRDNVTIRLCNDIHSWKYPLSSFATGNAPETIKYRKIIEDWAAISKQLSIWEYTANYDHYTAPMPNMHVLSPELKYYIAHNVTGMMLQGDYSGPHSDRATMRMWVMAKSMWNPSLSTDALIRDFNFGFYGKAAAPIQAYDELLNKVSAPYRDKILPNGIRFPTNVEFFSLDFVKRSLGLFEQAERLAQGDAKLLNRVEIAKLAIQYVILSRRKDFSYDEYAAALKQFSRVATANGLRYTKEPPSPDLPQKLVYFESKLRGRQVPVVPLPAAIAATIPVGKEAQNVIDVHPNDFTLWYEGQLVFKEDDPLASDGKTTRTVANTKMWTAQYPLTDIDDLDGDLWRTYVVARAKVKEGAPNSGSALNAGIYNTGTKTWTAEHEKSLEELAAGEYHVVDLGAHVLNNKDYIYTAPTNNPNMAELFVERIILVREPKAP